MSHYHENFVEPYDANVELEKLDKIKEKEDFLRHARGRDVNSADWELKKKHFEDKQNRLLHAMESCATSLSHLLTDFRLVYTGRGEVYSNVIGLTTTMGLVQIDLKRPELSPAFPKTLAPLRLPREPLKNLTIINKGTGTLFFATPQQPGDMRADVQLDPPATGTNPVPLTLNWFEPTVEHINLVANTSNLTLQLITVF
jgi:hypothetical protein